MTPELREEIQDVLEQYIRDLQSLADFCRYHNHAGRRQCVDQLEVVEKLIEKLKGE